MNTDNCCNDTKDKTRENDGTKEDYCPITLVSFSQLEAENQSILTLSCGHRFEETAIREVLSRQAKCPCCRKQINLEDYDILYIGQENDDDDDANTSDEDADDSAMHDETSHSDLEEPCQQQQQRRSSRRLLSQQNNYTNNDEIQQDVSDQEEEIECDEQTNPGLIEYKRICGSIPKRLYCIKNDIVLDSETEDEDDESIGSLRDFIVSEEEEESDDVWP